MQKDPLSLLVGFFRGNFFIIAVLITLVIVSTVIISKAVTDIAPIIRQTIGSTTELVERINETQAGFTAALERVNEIQSGFQSGIQSILKQVDGMSDTIAKIERIINRIPSKLLSDEDTGEWEPWSIEHSDDFVSQQEDIKEEILSILQEMRVLMEQKDDIINVEPVVIEQQPPVQVIQPRGVIRRQL